MSAGIEGDMLKRWNNLYGLEGFAPKYPHEIVVRWTFKSFPRDKAAETKILDLGCGAGRHALFFAVEGYQTFAVDFSSIAIQQLDVETAARRLNITTGVSECKALAFESESMDGLLSYAVLYYCDEASLKASISEIYRVLKPGGKALIMVKARSDSRFKYSTKTGVYAASVGPAPDDSWRAEVGMTLLFFDRSDLKSLFGSFRNVNVDLVSATYDDGLLTNDDFIITVVK